MFQIGWESRLCFLNAETQQKLANLEVLKTDGKTTENIVHTSDMVNVQSCSLDDNRRAFRIDLTSKQVLKFSSVSPAMVEGWFKHVLDLHKQHRDKMKAAGKQYAENVIDETDMYGNSIECKYKFLHSLTHQLRGGKHYKKVASAMYL